ncbi:HTH-type transcriptional regulator Hpr [Priestia megaterium]|uniref:HTH-type transcriptional regulator Hpr n=1 Tax=Priestia megaterium TaxID=1404 RepID=UPI001865F8EA|nr:HTH-type transcriptional regulator Hpr [Priestia megaterium]MBE2978060.1 HTH-type transcriptional regulator Hpr [Priestia megaterium]
MKSFSEDYTLKEATLFSLQLMQLSKIFWRRIENDWENLLKPFGININEHQILSMAYSSPYISITELAELGSMHITTAFNFSKKLKQKGYLRIIKNKTKKKNTCIELTKRGEELLIEILKNFKPHENQVFLGAFSNKSLYGKLPNFTELVTLMRNIYGGNLIALIDCCSSIIERNLIEEDGVLKRAIDKDVK